MEKKKKGAGGKLNRSEIVQARLSPKLRFGAELIARVESRTLSNLIETSLGSYVKNYKLGLVLDEVPCSEVTVGEFLEEMWSPDEVVRFANISFRLMSYLTSKEQELWFFILGKPYFWSCYQVDVLDLAGKFLRKDWEVYYHINGLLIENVKKYWDEIQTKEGRAAVNIPDKPGKEISPPAGAETAVYEERAYSKPEFEVGTEEGDRYSIWLKHISSLFKQEVEVVQTPQGNKINKKIVYPTPEEQMEMVERIYRKQLACQSNSTK